MTVVGRAILTELKDQGIGCADRTVEPVAVDLENRFAPDD